MRLAIHGGDPVIKDRLEPYVSIKESEREAVNKVIDSGQLSGFYGSWGEQFYGGVQIKALEESWRIKFRSKHAISMNSNTSGLYAAMAAIGISPGDEVIVPPYTMSATAMAPLIYGGIPVFTDISEETYTICPDQVIKNITDKTKAVIAVNLFGHPAELHKLKQICSSKGIFLIEDNAQAPLAKENGKYTGTIGDIGIFSLNYHKHIHCGEGGICVTDNDELAIRLQAVRNHSENVVDEAGIKSIVNMIGFNFRMTELSAAVASVQLAKIEDEVKKRVELATMLTEGIQGMSGIAAPIIRENCSHSYYVWGIKINSLELGISRESFSAALEAEGFPNSMGYTKPLYNLQAFKQRIAIGESGWPFTLTNRTYEEGLCKTSEKLYKTLICFEPCAYNLYPGIGESLVNALEKVYNSRDELRNV